MAQLKSDLKDLRESNKHLMDSIDILKTEKENNKSLKEYITYIEDKLTTVQNQKDSIQS
jgi:hypothetical protein